MIEKSYIMFDCVVLVVIYDVAHQGKDAKLNISIQVMTDERTTDDFLRHVGLRAFQELVSDNMPKLGSDGE